MPYINENTLNEILGRTDIVALISEYLPLKRSGKNFTALCPFHHEKTPSFIVSLEKQIYHCFGCQAGGNAFGFLMQYDRLEFPEAVEILAKKANIIIPKEKKSQNQGLINRLYEINEITADYYKSNLQSKEAGKALDYLKNRGIDAAAIERFQIGYALDKWDGLLSHLHSRKIPLSLIEKSGLVIHRNNAGHYDFFRKRIIIPIKDIRNRVVAFAARVLENTLPKYINSPETLLYSKSRTLYGLNVSRESIISNDLAIIVEGYFDLITSARFGIDNMAASCGTALTIEQVRLLKRYSSNVIMLYDSDRAGEKATVRSLELLIEEDMFVKVAQLKSGYDPDNFIRESGALKFKEALNNAKDIIDYKIDILQSKYSANDAGSKAKITAEILPLLNKFKNEVVKSEYIKKICHRISIEQPAVMAELKKLNKHPTIRPDVLADGFESAVKKKGFCPESMLIRLFLDEDEEMTVYLRHKINPEDFVDRNLNRILTMFNDAIESHGRINVNALINNSSDAELSKTICELAAYEMPVINDKFKLADDCIAKIREKTRRSRQNEIYTQLKTAQNAKDENRIKTLLTEFQLISKKG